LIEEDMIYEDEQSKEKNALNVNVVKVIEFQNKFVLFLAAIENAVVFHQDFWLELVEESPDIQKLHMLGTNITNSLELTASLYKKLNDLNPTHLRLLELYSSFLRDIVNDEIESPKILEKLAFITKNSLAKQALINGEEQKYSENSNTCVITSSGNLRSCGTITNCNGEITQILGFNKNDIIGQNVSKLMPKCYADVHDKFINNYFETAKDKIINMDRIVFPQNKQGYVVPCTLLIKVLPNLDEGKLS
jgi:PAS domain S-box-containing protein